MGNQVLFLVPFVREIMRNEVNIRSDITYILLSEITLLKIFI